MFAVGISKTVTDLVHLVWVKNNPNIIPRFQILLYPVGPGQLMAPFANNSLLRGFPEYANRR